MCGIVGILKSSPSLASKLLPHRAMEAIAHRGPDDEGWVFINRATGRWAQFSGPVSPARVA